MKASVIQSINQVQELLLAGSTVKFQGPLVDDDNGANRMMRIRKLSRTRSDSHESRLLAAPYYDPNTVLMSMEGEAEFPQSKFHETPKVEFLNQFIHQILSDKLLLEIQEQISTLSNLKFTHVYDEITFSPQPLLSPTTTRTQKRDSSIIVRLNTPTQSPTHFIAITGLRSGANTKGRKYDSWKDQIRDFLIGIVLGTTIVIIGYGLMKKIRPLSKRKKTPKHDYDSSSSSDRFDCITIKYVHQCTTPPTTTKKATATTTVPTGKFHARHGSKIAPLDIQQQEQKQQQQQQQRDGDHNLTKAENDQKDTKSSIQRENTDDDDNSSKIKKSTTIISSTNKTEEEESLSTKLDDESSSIGVNLKTKSFEVLVQKEMLNTESPFQSHLPSREECKRTSLLQPTDFSASAFVLSSTISTTNDDPSMLAYETTSLSTADSSILENEMKNKGKIRNNFFSSCVCAESAYLNEEDDEEFLLDENWDPNDNEKDDSDQSDASYTGQFC